MFDHLSFGVHDLARATAFYTRVLGTLGYKLQSERTDEVAFGPGEEWAFVLYPAEPGATVAGARMHLAFRAPSRDAVTAFHATSIEAGARQVPDRLPAERPQFGSDYFGAVVQDPDGHVLEVMTRQP